MARRSRLTVASAVAALKRIQSRSGYSSTRPQAETAAPRTRCRRTSVRTRYRPVIRQSDWQGRPGRWLRRLRPVSVAKPLPEAACTFSMSTMAPALAIVALFDPRDLGQEICKALPDTDTGRGLLAGLGIAFIGITADRLIGVWAKRRRRELRMADADASAAGRNKRAGQTSACKRATVRRSGCRFVLAIDRTTSLAQGWSKPGRSVSCTHPVVLPSPVLRHLRLRRVPLRRRHRQPARRRNRRRAPTTATLCIRG